MSRIPAGLVIALLLAPTGCNQSVTPGGSRTVSTASTSEATGTMTNRPASGKAEGSFELGTPVLPRLMKQGETWTTTISVNRDKNFKEDVTLKFNDVPLGVTVAPSTSRIKRGEKETRISIRAAEDAALGEFTIRVIGHPSKGADATSSLKLTIGD